MVKITIYRAIAKIVYLEDYFHINVGYYINRVSKYMGKQAHEVAIVT